VGVSTSVDERPSGAVPVSGGRPYRLEARGRPKEDGEATRPQHVLQILQPDCGGVPAYVDNLARGLAKRGWRVSLAGPPASASVQHAARSGVTVVPLVLPRGPHATRDAVAIAQLARFIRRENVDIVHAHSSKGGIVGAWAARLTGRGSVYTPHAWPFQMNGSWMAHAAYAGIERAHSRHGRDRIVLVSREEQAAGTRWSICPSEKMEVVRTGIPMATQAPSRVVARSSLGIDRDTVIAAWVGRGDPQKRPEDVTPLQERLGANARILALGDGLDQYLGARFLDAGGVKAPPGTSASTVYAAADILVHTAAWEGLPLVVLEAMQMGLPVIAYAVGGIVEQVVELYNGHLVDCGDVDSMAERILTVAGDSQLRARMSIAALERAELVFDYDRMVGQVERVYCSVIPPVGTGRNRHAGRYPILRHLSVPN